MANETDPQDHPGVEDGFEQVLEVTVASLENAGNEPWNPDAETGLNAVNRVEVLGQTNSAYRITWNYSAQQFDVVNVSDGTDVAATTDIGAFQVRVAGQR